MLPLPLQYSTTWATLHNGVPKDEKQIQQEIIWDNDHIKLGRRATWKTWKGTGILCINDLLHEHLPPFLSLTELGNKYGIDVSFLDVLQIRSAIPALWKRKLVSPVLLMFTIRKFFMSIAIADLNRLLKPCLIYGINLDVFVLRCSK